MTLYYNMLCGCQLEHEDLVKSKFTNYRLSCPDHPGGLITSRFTFCEVCDERRTSAPHNGRPSRFCAVHQKDQDKATKRKSVLNRIPAKTVPNILLKTRGMYNQFADTEKRAHCIHRDDCLFVYRWFHNLPCGACEFYKLKVQEIDGYKTNRNKTPETEHGNYAFK